MSKSVVAVAVLLLALALTLPAAATSAALSPTGGATETLTKGVLILKGALAVQALLLVIAARWAPRGAAFQPLVVRGLRAPRNGGAALTWALGGLAALALTLRLNALGVGLSFDEIDTLVHYARRPLYEIASTFDSQNQHLLYSLLARISFVALGESAFALRLPAALLGVLSVLAAHRVASLVTDRREAIFTAALLAVSYHHVWFSQNARGYTGLLLFALLGTEQMLCMFGESSPRGLRRPLAYGAWMALAALTHATAVLIVVGHALVWLGALFAARGRPTGPNRWQPALGGVFAASFSLIGYALVLPQFVETLLAPTLPGVQTVWKSPLWLISETFAGIARGVPGGAFTVCGGLVLVALGLRSYVREAPSALALFLAPTVVTVAALLATKHNLWPRMFFFGAGFYVLIALRGIVEWARIFSFGQLPALMGKLTTAALALACMANAATAPLAWRPKQDFEGPQRYLAANAQPGDAVVTVGLTTLVYAEYFIEPWRSVDIPDVARPDPERSLAALEAIEAAHPRTWIVFTTPPQLQARQPLVWRRIESEYDDARETFWGTLGGGEVVLARRDRRTNEAGAK